MAIDWSTMGIEGKEAEWPGKPYDNSNRPKREGRREHRAISQTGLFVAWDGEGYSTEDGDHHYMLFGNSLGEYVQGESLTWRECFPLLLQDRPKTISVIYSGNYDMVMMVKHMPRYKVLPRLFNSKAKRWGGYRMRYLRNKWLELKHIGIGKEGSTRLFDVFSFFQCSFVKACREYLGDDETLTEIARMKLLRDSFDYGDKSVIPYWQAELDYLVRLMNTLRELLAEVDIHPKTWHGPGAVASAVLQREGMRKYYGPIRADIVDLAERAYYGGRFEHFKVGRIGKCYEYDIRSAYPSAMLDLPDFGSATWQHISFPVKIHDHGLYRISWKMKYHHRAWRLGPFPWRDQMGQIFFPLQGVDSWYWGVEVNAAIKKMLPEEYEVIEGWVPRFVNDDRPFAGFVQDMYDKRAEMRAAGNPAEKALKLALNSLYGKLAQSAGASQDEKGNWKKPSWHNVLWAGYITAATRAKLMNALRTMDQMASIVAIETDALFTMEPLNVPISTNLGEWDCIEIDEMLYIRSGQYYACKDGVWSFKSRGVEADRSKSAQDWLDIFARLPEESVDISHVFHRFGSDIRQYEHFGKWYDTEATATLPSKNTKRVHHFIGCKACSWHKSKGLPVPSFAETFHDLIVPPAKLSHAPNYDCEASTPYKFPWRTDARYEWPEHIHSEIIFDTEGIQWH